MSEIDAAAEKIVGRFTKWSAGAGLIPVPVLDIAAVAGIQLKMVSKLAQLYGVPFSRDRSKTAISALVGSVVPFGLTSGTTIATSTLLKSFPLIGTAVGIATMPAFAAAATYAVGKVFTQHFASGGTLLDLNPQTLREHFRREFEHAKESAPSEPAKATAPAKESLAARAS